MRIVISARPYDETVGGHVVLHKLCESLIREGLPAVLRPDSNHPWAINPAYQCAVTDHVEPDDVVIYHDSIKGNPWNARKFIRWMLYIPKHDRDGVVLYYSDKYGPGPYLNIIEPHLDLFRDRGESRSGLCWTWRKAERQGWRKSQRPNSGTEIPRGTSNRKLADIFNHHERFVCYDGASWLAVQAALCGCDVIVPRPVGGAFPYPGTATSAAGLPKARAEHAALREQLETQYRDQDKKSAEIIRWSVTQLQ